MKHLQLTLLVTSFLLSATLFAHGPSDHGAKSKRTSISTEETSFGREGNPTKVTRTIKVDMNDTMRFDPTSITVRRGETIRFVVANSGKTMHEMVLGTLDELKKHAELMRKHPGMEHDEPYMAHVAPGKRETIVWAFTKPGEFYYGCLVPGHFEAGMIGKVVVAQR